MKKILVILGIILFVSVPVVAQEIDYCEGDFDNDGDQDGTDAAKFKSDFGRSTFQNPCPPPNPAPAPVEKTGVDICYDELGLVIDCTGTGQDGELQKGVVWPNPRFTDNLDGTVTDNLTGLIWLRNANCVATNYPGFDNDGTAGDGMVTWQHALDFVAGINAGTYPDCGAGSADWRLPNWNELASLVHKGYYGPAVPNTVGTGQWSEGDPFTTVQSYWYWSSTTFAYSPDLAWGVGMGSGLVFGDFGRTRPYYVWPVRGGH